MLTGLDSSKASHLVLQMATLLLPLHRVFPLCGYVLDVSLCAQIPPLCKIRVNPKGLILTESSLHRFYLQIVTLLGTNVVRTLTYERGGGGGGTIQPITRGI